MRRSVLVVAAVVVAAGGVSYARAALPVTAGAGPAPSREVTLAAKRTASLPKPAQGRAPGTPSPRAAAPPRAILRPGMRGDDVADLQRRLAALRFDQGAVDGVFGDETAHAVVALQKLHGLDRTGVVDAATRAKLRAPTLPRPRQPRAGLYLEADLTRQLLVAFRGTAVDRIIDTSSAQQGVVVLDGQRFRSRTPTGAFTVERLLDGWRQSRWGMLYRPAYFHDGFAIHGVADGPKPYPASLGCLNVTMGAMDRLRTVITVGTPITIYAS